MIEYELFKQRQRELQQQAHLDRLAREARAEIEPHFGPFRRLARGLRHTAPLKAAGPAGY
ncbi:hypothetical protein [Kitasatospora camelliae]|uniref:DDE family transposase n=1 Tax=Kitasatospora camelliae TaxID=3156397 RepID=A0AAU8JYN3_9ACTN